MPLKKGKSDATRSANIAAEIRSGKPPAQAEAIAYSEQRKARSTSGKGEYQTTKKVKGQAGRGKLVGV